MKKEFTFDELMSNRGCYSEEDVVNVFGNFESITLIEILNSNTPLMCKTWFLYNSCDLTLQEQKDLCYLLVEAVIPVYNKKYPKDDRVSNCMKAIKDFDNNLITKEELLEFGEIVIDAYINTHCVDTTAFAVYCVAKAATHTCTSNAIGAAYTAAYKTVVVANNAIYHPDLYSDPSDGSFYSDSLLKIMIDFVNNN